MMKNRFLSWKAALAGLVVLVTTLACGVSLPFQFPIRCAF